MAETVRKPILYPKHINLYAQCPERYYHERVERQRSTTDSGAALAKGIAAHQALATIAQDYETYYLEHGVPSLPSDLRCRAAGLLPREAYPCEATWSSAVDTLVEELRYGTSYLDGEARVIATEATLQYPYAGSPECPAFMLAAKVDLVLRRRTPNGDTYLDVIDWKTGRSLHSDPVQELAARIVVQHNAARLRGGDPTFIQNTTVFLGARTHRSAVIDAVDGPRRWDDLKNVVTAIQTSSNWAPNPSPLCEWCPYFGNGCSLGDQVSRMDDIAIWLDAVAQ